MKTEFLKGLGLTDEQVSAIMAENGKDIGKEQAKLVAVETERDTYKGQLETANTEIQSYKEMDIEGIKAKAGEWETKYNTDLAALQTKLDGQAYDFALKEYIGGYNFTSELVKDAVISQLKSKAFKLDDGKFLGADEFMEQLKTANPTAFGETSKPPTITIPGAGNPTPGKKLSLTEVMALKNANPDLDITQYL